MSEMRRPTEAATGALSEARDKTANRSYEQMMIWRAASVKAAMDQNKGDASLTLSFGPNDADVIRRWGEHPAQMVR